MSRRTTTDVVRPIESFFILPNGDSLNEGDTIKVAGTHATFRFRYEWRPDGSLSCYGPIYTSGKDAGKPKEDAQWRAMRPSSVTHVNGKRLRRESGGGGEAPRSRK